MKVNSTTRPLPYKIFVIKDRALIRFAENIVEEKREDGIMFAYDEFSIETKNRAMLKISIEENFESWVSRAKETEIESIAADVRDKRNLMLAETDSYFYTDRLIDDETRADLVKYRQELRDITAQPGFPSGVVYPILGNKKEEIEASEVELIREKIELEKPEEPIILIKK